MWQKIKKVLCIIGAFITVLFCTISLFMLRRSKTDRRASNSSDERESKKESQELKTELQDVKEDYNEQKIYYETQLTEAKKREKNSFFLSLINNFVSAILSVVILISFIF